MKAWNKALPALLTIGILGAGLGAGYLKQDSLGLAWAIAGTGLGIFLIWLMEYSLPAIMAAAALPFAALPSMNSILPMLMIISGLLASDTRVLASDSKFFTEPNRWMTLFIALGLVTGSTWAPTSEMKAVLWIVATVLLFSSWPVERFRNVSDAPSLLDAVCLLVFVFVPSEIASELRVAALAILTLNIMGEGRVQDQALAVIALTLSSTDRHFAILPLAWMSIGGAVTNLVGIVPLALAALISIPLTPDPNLNLAIYGLLGLAVGLARSKQKVPVKKEISRSDIVVSISTVLSVGLGMGLLIFEGKVDPSREWAWVFLGAMIVVELICRHVSKVEGLVLRGARKLTFNNWSRYTRVFLASEETHIPLECYEETITNRSFRVDLSENFVVAGILLVIVMWSFVLWLI